MALEEIKNTFEIYANYINGWKTMNKNELVNLYIKNEEDEFSRECYYAAIILRYWGNIGKYYKTSMNSFDIEDCYEWLISAINYALDKRKWLEEGNKLFNDPQGPDKVINRCIFSERQIHYQASNTDKRRVNFTTASIDKQKEKFRDHYKCEALDEQEGKLIKSESDIISEISCSDIVKDYIKKDNMIEALVVDAICYQDVFNKVKIDKNSFKNEFSERKLVKHLNEIDDSFMNYFVNKYCINKSDENILLSAISNIKTQNNIKMYKTIRKSLNELKLGSIIKERLCY